MIYNILVDADKHWGASRCDDQFKSAFLLKQLLQELPIDLYVSDGDFFDTKLLLNSKASIFALRDMHERVAICRDKGIPIRVVQGTYSHDYDQLDAFSSLMDDAANNFKYFMTNTLEETLPGLQCIYCPDENMNYAKYQDTYADRFIVTKPNIGFFHGNFDKVLADVALRMFNAPDSNTLVYRYDDLAMHIKGPMVCGHWHDFMENDQMIYVGSTDRWIFGEDEDKGFSLIQYDTETCRYKHVRIPNILAPVYRTYRVNTSVYKKVSTYAALYEAIDESLAKDPTMKIRIYVVIDKILPDTEENISQMKFKYANERRVSVTLKNKVRDAIKLKEKEEHKHMDETYGFIRNANMKPEEKIREWIRIMMGTEYTQDEISRYVIPYLQNQ